MPTAAESPRLLLTRQEAADRLGLKIRTFDQLVADGHVEAVRINRLVRFNPAELERFAREGVASRSA